MLNNAKKYGAFFVLSLVVACAGVPTSPYERFMAGYSMENFPYKVGDTAPQTTYASTECEIEAAQRVPQNLVVHSTPASTMPASTVCNQIGTQTFCNTVGGGTIGGTTYTTDANSSLRYQAYGMCMVRKGYQFVNVPACPKGTTGQDMHNSNVLRPFSLLTCWGSDANNNIFMGDRRQ